MSRDEGEIGSPAETLLQDWKPTESRSRVESASSVEESLAPSVATVESDPQIVEGLTVLEMMMVV